MKKWIDILRMLLVCTGFTTLAYAQPANDACGAATPLTVGVGSCNSILYTNVAATSIGDPVTPACWSPLTMDNTVWFSFVATSANIEISTNFGGTLADTQIAVYSGTCGALTQIACQEDVNTITGLLHTDVIVRGLTVGNTYYILVDGNGNATGTFGICVQQTAPLGPTLPTQDCVGAQSLCNLNNIVVPNGPGGTGTSVEAPSCFGNPGERSSNWYTFTAGNDGTLSFTITPNTVIDYDFAVYETTNSCPGTEIACNWQPESGTGVTGLGCGGAQCEPSINLIAGHTYTILVDRYTAASTSGFTLAFDGTSSDFTSPTPTFTATTACIGTATQFTNTTPGNYSYSWNFGDGYTSNVANPTHTYANSGTYSVTLLLTTVPGGCQNASTRTVTVNPIPTVDAGIGGSVCPGGCITLGGSTNAVGSSGTVSFSNATDFAIPDNNNTGITSSVTVSGLSPATIGATSIASVCLNIDHTFDADLDIFLVCPDGTRMRLSTDNGGLDQDYIGTCFSPTASTQVATGTAPFTGTFLPDEPFTLLNGCTANGTWSLFVRDDTGGDVGTLRDWTITFNNNLPAFTWTPTTAMTNSTTLSPTVCPTATTVYTLTANNGPGCTASDTVTINYTSVIRPVLTCGFTTAVSVQFNWAALIGATGYLVSYQINSGPIVNAGDIFPQITCTINGLLPGDTVTLTVTPIGGAGTCFGPQSLTCATSNCVAPAIPTISTTAPTCSADGFTTITNYNAANTYAFSPVGPTVGAGGTITGAAFGTSYTITATNVCTSAASAPFTNLVRLTTPIQPILSTTAPTCAADGLTTILNYSSANTYAFSPAGPTVNASGIVTGATFGSPYTITSNNGSCTSASSTSFTNVVRLATPPVPTISTIAPTCAADGFTTITNYNAANTYTFSPAGPTAGAGGTITGATFGTNYTITATSGTCTSLASAPFTNLARLTTPATPIVSTTAPSCAADGFTTITNYNAGYTYAFTPPGPTAGAGGTITGTTFGTNYTVTASNGGCSSIASTSFTDLIRLATPPVPTVSNAAPTCAADGFTTIANYNAANTYTFSPAGPTAAAGGTITGATLGTNYTITATSGTCTSLASAPFTNLARLTTPATPVVSTTAPTCAADGFTTITNYNAGYTYAFTPTGPTAGAGGTISGATFGTNYTITASTGGCTSAASASFNNQAMLVTPAVPLISTTAPTCTANGFSVVTNYDPTVTYASSPLNSFVTAGTGQITNAVLGTSYTFTATNGSCTSPASAPFTNLPITAGSIPMPGVTTTAPTCTADGFTVIDNYNAANTYNFTPIGPTAGAGGAITGAVLGASYIVVATNNGCTSPTSPSFTNLVRLTTPAVPTISTTAPTCAADGFTSITNYNAANTYTFSPTGPNAGAGGTITGAVFGTSYTITASNGGCTSLPSASFSNLAQLITPPTPTVSTTAPTCTADGFTSITNYNVANTYTFSPTGPTVGTGGTVTGAGFGTSYTITATANGCLSGTSTSFSNLVRLVTPAVPSISLTPASCSSNGFTTIVNYNPANTYTFTPTGPTAGAGGIVSGTVPGTSYTITASNGSCTSGPSIGFINQAQLTTPAVPTVSTTAPSCTADGFTSITNYDATVTYIFAPTGPTAGAGGTITGAVFGTSYTIMATRTGCTSATSASFTNLPQLITPAVPILATTAPTCLADGYTTITNYSATDTYVFSPAGPTAGAGGTITGATLGTTYTITATNGNCTSGASASFTNLVRLVNLPTPVLNTTAPSCTADGFTTITNYVPGFTYTFTPSGPTVGAGGIITGAVLGTTYTLIATQGICTSTVSAPFSNSTMLVTPAIPALLTTAPTCTANGFTSITNYNAANTYTFMPTGPTAGTGGIITGAVLGTTYTVTSTNGGCTSGAASFTNSTQLATPPVPTFITTAPTCSADGSTRMGNYNFAYIYTFSPTGPTVSSGGVMTGVAVGTTYTVTASNANCTSASSIAFTNLPQLPTPALPSLNTTAPTCTADGFTTITNYSASNTYIFSPTGPAAGSGGAITGAALGTVYAVTAVSGSCTSASTLFSNLAQLATPAVPTVLTTAPTCTADGFTSITNYNVANTYAFSPTGPTTSAGGIINGAIIGTTYTITASNGSCVSLASAPFTNATRLGVPPVPLVSTTAPTCTSDGFTTITNYDPAAIYTFTPVGPNAGTGGVITGATVGTSYTITSTKGGCTSAASASFRNLIMLPTPVAPTLSTTAPTCNADGFTTITNYSTANTYTFSPTGPTAGVGGTISGATPGTAYTVTSTNGGCTSATASFTNPVRLFNVNISNLPPVQICDDNNDGHNVFNLSLLIPTITGGNPYQVSFHETPTDAAIGGTTIPRPGSYTNINPFSQTIYVRLQSNTSPCFVVAPLQLIVNRIPEATEPRDYHVCDDDADGSAIFNLTTVAAEVFGTINQSTHSISYYTDFGDAQSGINNITSISSFPSSGQTIWIRVRNNATGCFDIVTLELIVDPLPRALHPNYPQYSLCDKTLPLGHEEFNLGLQISTILNNQTGMDVTFHLNQADADADRNPLPLLYTNIAPFVQTIFIRIENTTTRCYTTSTIDIRVMPLPSPIPPGQAHSVCDNNQDGYSTFNLNSLTTAILQGANYTITYHETLPDAERGDNPLASPYDNIRAFSQFIYVRAVDNVNGCQSVIPIELKVNPQPMIPFNVPDLTKCDQDANPNGNSTIFDLTQNDSAVLSIQPLAPTNYTVTYHILESDARNDNAPIIGASTYLGTNHEVIWVRVEDNATGCFSVGSFELLINSPLALTTPSPLSICDAVPNDQFATFDLTIKNREITGGQANMTVTYYPSSPVTPSSVAIPNPTAYPNDPSHPAVQTLGVKVTTPQGCVSYTTLDIRVLPTPSPVTGPIPPLPPQCDVNNTGDMMEIFNLTANANIISGNDPNVTLHYYPTRLDALGQTHEILTPGTALVGQNVWIRVENTQIDYQNNNCFILVEQPLTVYPLPATMPASVVQECDDDSDGQALFNLSAVTSAFYGSANLSFTYHTSFGDAQSGNNAIGNATAYPNTSNPQIIYVRVRNNVTGCVNYNSQFTLQVNPKPIATAPANFETCDIDALNDGFFALDLSTYISGIIGSQTGVSVTFYNNQANAANEVGAITNLTNYQTYSHTIWIRVENDTTGCFELVPFVNTVERLAEPTITAPSDVICVEYGSNVLLNGLTLSSGITNPNYTFEWFEAASPTTVIGTGSTYSITTVAPGTYSVVATSTNPPLLGCISRPDSFVVTQSGPPQFASPPFMVSNYFDDNQIITVNVVGFGVYEFSLDDGPFQSSNVFSHASLGSHSITVRDATGQTSCGEIFLNGIQTINYPHYFTPNGDGFNDTWNIVGLQNQPNARLYIFDRYGKLLKQLSTTDQSKGWDGTYNGHMLPADDYWFSVEYTEGSQQKEFKAHFTLKR